MKDSYIGFIQYLIQFFTFNDFMRLNSFSLFVGSIKSMLNAQAVINKSSEPIMFPSHNVNVYQISHLNRSFLDEI